MGIFEPTKGVRVRPAWEAMVALLSDGERHDWHRVLATGLLASDLKYKTVSNLIYRAVREGIWVLEREGDGRDDWWLSNP